MSAQASEEEFGSWSTTIRSLFAGKLEKRAVLIAQYWRSFAMTNRQGFSGTAFPPLPPEELRRMVGPVEEKFWNNESGRFFLDGLPIFRTSAEVSRIHQKVFDFGCGSGRVARHLLMQTERPRKYFGLDVSRRMIEWCQEQLTPYDNNFVFEHHDVFSPTYAPDNSRNSVLPLPTEGDEFTLLIAHSVFTHLFQEQMIFYLKEFHRVMELEGIIYSTWFFFNRKAFTVLAPHQNCIFVNELDPSQAVFYDWEFFCKTIRSIGLKIAWVDWTRAPGFHTNVYLHKSDKYPDLAHRLVPPSTVIGY